MNVENKLDKVVNILKEKGFVVYRKGGKEPGVFYAKQYMLRLGIILYGFRLTFQDMGYVGLAGVLIDALVLTTCATS